MSSFETITTTDYRITAIFTCDYEKPDIFKTFGNNLKEILDHATTSLNGYNPDIEEPFEIQDVYSDIKNGVAEYVEITLEGADRNHKGELLDMELTIIADRYDA